MKKFLIGFFVVLASLFGASFTNQFSHFRNVVKWGMPITIYDFRTHPYRIVKAAAQPQPWGIDSSYNKKQIPQNLLDTIEKQKTVAFLVIQNGKIKYERYWDHGVDSLSGSFSAAKSIISLLIGIAIDEGKIKSVDQLVSDFIPHFKENGLDQIKIKNLLTMSSGTNWLEKDRSYFSLNAYAYFGDDEEFMVNKLSKKEDAGKNWEYRSGDTQVLGLIVEKVFGNNISDLVSEKLFKPMGAEKDAKWLVDGAQKHEKAYCCFNGIARDYARFGQLVLNDGVWNGKRIVSSAYLKDALTPASYLKDPIEGGKPVDYYGYQYWIINHPNGMKVPSMNGLYGQYVYILKEKNAIIVRLGTSPKQKHIHHYQPENFEFISAGLSVLD
jgi:CubicO group peptidase (beta-lactamase class C family)